jgi:hypothetical protein
MSGLMGGSWRRGSPAGHLRVPGRCAGKCHHNGLVGTQPAGHLQPRQLPTRLRTGNASVKFVSLDRYVAWRLKRLLIKKRGRNLRAGQADRWTRTWFHDQGLHKLMGTIRYPKAA